MTLSLQPLLIATDASEEHGVLVFSDAKLVAIFARLDAPHYGEERGHWHLEAGSENALCVRQAMKRWRALWAGWPIDSGSIPNAFKLAFETIFATRTDRIHDDESRSK